MAPDQRADVLRRLAQLIERAGLRGPLSMVLDTLRPLDVVSSQCALFVRPFALNEQWRQYADVLADETGWQELRALLARQDS